MRARAAEQLSAATAALVTQGNIEAEAEAARQKAEKEAEEARQRVRHGGCTGAWQRLGHQAAAPGLSRAAPLRKAWAFR